MDGKKTVNKEGFTIGKEAMAGNFIYIIWSMKNFKELKIWQKGFEIAGNCLRLTETFPERERFGLSLQITRAAISIPSNIAEGSSRSTHKDNKRFIHIALGSAFELETQLLIAKALQFGNQELLLVTLDMLTEEEKMLTSFIKSIANRYP